MRRRKHARIFMTDDDRYCAADRLDDYKKYQRAFQAFRALANRGYAAAMSRLATMYDFGHYVDYDFDAVLYWETQALEHGFSAGRYNLGVTWRRHGDLRKARDWFESALQHGDLGAALQLAKLYCVSDKENERVKALLRQVVADPDAVRIKVTEADYEEAQALLDEFEQREREAPASLSGDKDATTLEDI
jgi:TPR repeat protein